MDWMEYVIFIYSIQQRPFIGSTTSSTAVTSLSQASGAIGLDEVDLVSSILFNPIYAV